MSKSNQTSSKTLKVKTSVKAGPRYAIWWSQHNETQVREPKNTKTLKVKTSVKAGPQRKKWGIILGSNHNETQLRK